MYLPSCRKYQVAVDEFCKGLPTEAERWEHD